MFIPQVIYEHGETWWNYIERERLLIHICLLFILQVLHEQRETRWNDINGERLLIRPPELSGNPTSCHLAASRRNGQSK
jgi:hypothetical protein